MAEEMDVEWMELILEAKKIGMTTEMVREFLNQSDIGDAFIKKS